MNKGFPSTLEIQKQSRRQLLAQREYLRMFCGFVAIKISFLLFFDIDLWTADMKF
jgi:hypothetical protein